MHRILRNVAFLMLTFCASQMGCRTQTALYTDTFEAVFLHDSTTFRGVNLGQSLALVEQLESQTKAAHADELGLSYQIELPQGYSMLVDYFSDEMASSQPQAQLKAIVANILMGDEVETAAFYNEIRNFFNRQYGVSSGVFGDLVWETSTHQTASMEVRLIMHENKTGIRLNFIDRVSSAQTN